MKKSIVLLLSLSLAIPFVALTSTSCTSGPGYGPHHVHPGDVRFNQHGRYKHGKRTHAEKKYMRPRG